MPFARPTGHAGAIKTEEAVARSTIRRTNEPSGHARRWEPSIATPMNRTVADAISNTLVLQTMAG
jgi:hypothetical protein